MAFCVVYGGRYACQTTVKLLNFYEKKNMTYSVTFTIKPLKVLTMNYLIMFKLTLMHHKTLFYENNAYSRIFRKKKTPSSVL